ncbi:MAG: hydroxymethylbilane synthase [Clostridia bacterium]|nr:hydroxymethylbilane synthase [Clostridia bacterium]
MNKKIRIGSRESKLAVLQSQIIIDLIKKHCPQYEIELVTMKTTGDRILDRTLDKVGGKGLFVKELDKALLNGEVDLTVHSLKDVPMEIDERIPLVAFTECEYPYDVLVLPKGTDKLDLSKPIGSSSMRRSIQIKKIYPDAEIKPIRGNVITRLKKLDSGEYSALILAQAGLERLGLSYRISRVFNENEIIPAAGQGVIAVQGRKEDNFDFVKYINNKNSKLCAEAERSFVKELNGGCSSPVAAFAVLKNDKITINGLYAENNIMNIQSITGKAGEGKALGKELAKRVREVL